MIDNSCSLTTVMQSCQRRLQTKYSPGPVSLVAFWHRSQTDVWSGWCFVAHKEALSGTSPTWAATALLPRGRRRAHCRTSAFQLTSACSTSSVEVLPPERKAPQPMTYNYYSGSLPWLQPATGQHGIDPLFGVGPGQVRSGLGLQVFSDSVNNKLIFSSCQTKEPGRLKLTLISAVNICRKDLSFQLSNLACIPVFFYRRHYIACIPWILTISHPRKELFINSWFRKLNERWIA